MAKIEVNKVELVWPGKYNEDGTLKEVPRVNLPFQVIERVNVSRATREAKKRPSQLSLFDVWEGKEGETFEEGWRNKLIWGDNLLVMGGLLDNFAGKIDLIYIDPPFATGADFTITSEIGEDSIRIEKSQSIIEEKAYRDTWGRGQTSYLSMIYNRLLIMRDLLSPTGSIYIHCDWRMSASIRLLMDEIFGSDFARNSIVWKRTSAHNDPQRYGIIDDRILFYTKSDIWTWNNLKTDYEDWYIERYYRYVEPETGRRFLSRDITGPAHGGTSGIFEWKGKWPGPGRMWAYTRDHMEKLEAENRIFYTQNGMPRLKQYLDEMEGRPVQSIWDDILPIVSWSDEGTGFATQKPEDLIERIILSSSNERDLVADFFCGSGTTLAVAEKLGRRWIGCDLGRYAIHTSRKRLLGISECKPFEILNLGKYERRYWQSITFPRAGEPEQQALYEYLAFILRLYGAQPISGTQHLHGKKGKALIHIGAVDAPVTIDEVAATLDECLALKQNELHILGWEWEMGLNDLMVDEARHQGVKLLLLQIPREVMEQQAVDKGDIHFFELAYLEVDIEAKGLDVQVALKDFVIPNTELIPEDVREKVQKWSDYIDYWAVDWDFQEDTFIHGWVAYRTRQERKLPLKSDMHTYKKPGKYTIVVKVIDIFGNDTTQAFEVEVK